MLTLIRNTEVYAPEALGRMDILFSGERIVAMASELRLDTDVALSEVDGNGTIACPGFIDPLVHITGGGGEGGFHTRTPQMRLEEATLAGVTTVVGALGTDATSRTLPDLLAKCYALRHLGLGCFLYTGSYQVPVKTLLADIGEDLMLLEPFIGVGEVAIGDHRSSHPTPQELIRLASQARTGAMLAGKSGIVLLHLGDDPNALDWLQSVVAQSNLPLSQFYPTHVNRTADVFETAMRFGQAGGWLDITTSTTAQLLAMGEVGAAEALVRLLEAGISADNITFSSDGNASLPAFNEHGELVGMEVGRVQSLHQTLVQAVSQYQLPLEQVLACVTSNVANRLGLGDRGQLRVGKRADLVLLDAQNLGVRALYSGGKAMVQNGRAVVTELF